MLEMHLGKFSGVNMIDGIMSQLSTLLLEAQLPPPPKPVSKLPLADHLCKAGECGAKLYNYSSWLHQLLLCQPLEQCKYQSQFEDIYSLWESLHDPLTS